MKKITLFIAFLAISIGAVWGEVYPVLTGSTTDQNEPFSDQNLPFSVSITECQHIQMIYPASYFKNGTADPSNNVYRYKFEMNFIKSLTFTAANAFTEGGMITYTAGKLQISSALNCTIKVATINSQSQSQYSSNSFITNITNIPNSKEVVVNSTNCVINGADITISLPETLSFSANDNLLIDIEISSTQSGISLTDGWLANNSLSTNQALYQQGQGDIIISNVLPALKVDCSRKLIDVTSTDTKDNSYKYDVFSSESGSNFTAYVVLKNCQFKSRDGHYGDYFINPSTSHNSDDGVIDIKRGYIYIIPSTLPAMFADGTSYSPSVTKLSNNLSFSGLDEDEIIVFPENLVSVGDNESTSNTVFDGLGGKVVIFPATSNNVPSFVGSSSSASTAPKPYLFVYDNCSTDINAVSGWQNSGVLDATNRNYGWCSHPYDAKLHLPFISNSVEISRQTSNDARPNDVVEIYQHPFKDTPIEIQITANALERSNDGTTHYYTKFTESSNVNPTEIALSGEGTNKVSAVVNKTADFDLYLGYYAEVKVGDGNPTYANGDGGISKNDVFKDADSLVFRYTDENEVPHWTYTGDNPSGSAEAIPVNTQIRVEKKIDNSDYHYFSLPFACKVSDIEVRYFSDDSNPSDGRNGNNTLSLLKTDINSENFSADHDYFIIQKYDGQSKDLEEKARYTQIIDDVNGTLEPYKGYAFAVIESDNHYHHGTNPDKVEAMIVFKSDVSKNTTNGVFTNLFGSTTYSGFKINNLVDYTSRDISNLNRGWNLVGNPFYFPIKGNSYGDSKYFAKIDNSVGVNKLLGNNSGRGIKVVHIRTDIQSVDINPFEAIFLQVPDDTKEVEINPAPQVSNSPSTMGSAINSMPEHLSVKITDANNVSDRTTVINMAGRDTSFVIGDDFAKMMNPGAQIYSWFSNVPCVFKELPLREDSSYIVPLGVIAPATGNYTFALDTSLTLFYGAAMLHDKQMNQYHPLTEEGVQISLNKGTDNARFELVIVPSEIPADVENVETSETLDAYVHDGRLVVENIEAGSTLSIFDITGRMLYSAPAVDNFNYQFSAHGVYMVVLQGNTTGSIKVVY